MKVMETRERVSGIQPDLRTRFLWRAERRARKLNEQRSFASFYRWEVQGRKGRYRVVAMQNVAVPE